MNAVVTKRKIGGARIDPLDAAQVNAWLDWLTSTGPTPAEPHNVLFALAHCDSGVTWGYLDDQRQWQLGTAVDPGLCPVPTARSLHELRLFGYTAEVLIWRGDDGLQGRILADDQTAFERSDALRPLNEGRRLRGKRGDQRNGFVPYVDVGGSQHLAPSAFPEEFSVRHYLEQDPATGAVRIAVTRLVSEKLS